MSTTTKTALIITAHADDHIACAGTLFKLQDQGHNLFEVLLTDSSEGRDFRNPTSGHDKQGNVATMRQTEFEQASVVLRTKEVIRMHQEDLNLQYSKELVFQSVEVIRRIRPSVGLIHAGFDWHPDHHQAYRIASEAFKMAATDIRPELGDHWRTPIVLAAENTLTIQPNVLVDITDYMPQKMKLWETYASQASPRDISFEQGIMSVRGYHMWKQGDAKAEAFHTDPTSPLILFESAS
jgi:LmbE family N-acetylglucosaminyl deacetylase